MANLRLKILVVLAFAAALLAPATARAHSRFESATPSPVADVSNAPGDIEIHFTSPFNKELMRVELFDALTGLEYPARVTFPHPDKAVLKPEGLLPTAAYEVRWHTVGAYDGHVLEGTFGFGVRARPIDATAKETTNPFSGTIGLVRVSFKTLMLIALFIFAGGVLVPTLLRLPGRFGTWLLPPGESDLDKGSFMRRAEARTLLAGWLTCLAGLATTLIDAYQAGHSLSPHVLKAYLLTNISGYSRLSVLALVACAAGLLARRCVRLAAVAVVFAFLAMAFGGHSFQPSHRTLAITTDWVHLVAAAVWAGGIAQLGLAWIPSVVRRPGGLRRAVMRDVLNRFGRVALPAFVVIVVSGSINALIRLGTISNLWATPYGRVLAVKITVVGLIALASYVHAMHLRPRLLRTIRPQPVLERKHWRLLGSEPFLAAAVVAAVAVLVAFPLPPGQAKRREQTRASAKPAPAELIKRHVSQKKADK